MYYDQPIGSFKSKLRKIGKYTSKITTAAAKAVLPPSLVDVAARFDPTRKKGGAGPAAPEAPASGGGFSLGGLSPLMIGGVAVAALFLLSRRR